MAHCIVLTTAQIKAAFAQEIAAAGGTTSDTFDDGSRLLTRSILPGVREVRPKDWVQGGVALKAAQGEVWVHPYVFRQVCQNGAIMAQTLGSRHLELDLVTAEEATSAVRAAVRSCCDEDAFVEAAEGMRSSVLAQADLMLNLMPMLDRLPSGMGSQILTDILRRFFQEPDRSRFALGNAVTAAARDARDPDVRWRLEEFGGGILAGTNPQPRRDGGTRAIRSRSVEAAVV